MQTRSRLNRDDNKKEGAELRTEDDHYGGKNSETRKMNNVAAVESLKSSPPLPYPRAPQRTSLGASVLISRSYHYFRGGLFFLSLMSFAPFCSVIQKLRQPETMRREREKIIN